MTIPAALGLPAAFTARDLISGETFAWRDGRQLRPPRPVGGADARDEGGGVSAIASIEPDIALLAARDHHEPHRVLGAHPVTERRRGARLAPGRADGPGGAGRRRPDRAAAPRARACSRRSCPGRARCRATRWRWSSATRSRVRATRTRSCPRSASARPAPGRRGEPPGPVGAPGRAPPRDRRRAGRRLHGLGAVGALGERGGRLERLGRARAPDAHPGGLGHLGAVRPGRGRGRAVQVRDPGRRRVAAPEGRPRGAARPSTRPRRPPRPSSAATSGGTRSGWRPGRGGARTRSRSRSTRSTCRRGAGTRSRATGP